MSHLYILQEIIEEAKTTAWTYNIDVLQILHDDASTSREKAVYMIAIGILQNQQRYAKEVLIHTVNEMNVENAFPI